MFSFAFEPALLLGLEEPVRKKGGRKPRAEPPTFQLDCIHPTLLEHAHSRTHGISHTRLIGAKGQVTHQKGAAGTTCDSPAGACA